MISKRNPSLSLVIGRLGDKYGISRERVGQILASNPEFEAYGQKQKENNFR